MKNSFIQDINFKNSFQWSPFYNHTIEGGVEMAFQIIAPQKVMSKSVKNPNTSENTIKYQGLQNSLFIEDKISLNRYFGLTLGFRAATFNTGGKSYIFLEPRTNFQIALSKKSNIELSYRENNQPLHLLTSSGIGLPNDIWVPATAKAHPSHGRLFSGGFNTFFEKQDILFSVEGYYRTMSNLIDFRQGTNFFSIDKNWENVIEINGKGRAYGFELMAHKKSGRFNGWISYTLAWNERQFTKINNGAWFPHQYDRRHEFSFTANYKLAEDWSLSSNFVFATGNAFTAPSYFAIVYQNSQGVDYAPIFTGKNNRRTPVYHRLDIAATKTYESKRGRDCNLSFGIYNIYAHNNPFYVDISLIALYPPKSSYAEKLAFRSEVGSVFNLIPFISYAVKF